MRFHVVGLPWELQPQDAYANKVERFAPMMEALGHEVITYRSTQGEWDLTQTYDPGSPSWRAMNARVAAEIAETAEQEDFVCLIAGRCQQAIAEALPALTAVEFGVGYGGVFAKFRVFESYAWMHMIYGSLCGGDPHTSDGRFYDTVIPNYLDASQFPEGDGDGGYYLFMGRLIERKGFQIAADVCQQLGERLILAGEGAPPSYGEHVGVVGPEERAALMGGAKAVFMPTLYVEPFGAVAIEAMMCGTPMITTDWGAFTETVRPGIDGYRCHTMAEFVDAAKRAPDLDRGAIRVRALSEWSMPVIGRRYEAYFERLLGLWGDGFYGGPIPSRAEAPS